MSTCLCGAPMHQADYDVLCEKGHDFEDRRQMYRARLDAMTPQELAAENKRLADMYAAAEEATWD